MQPSGFYFAQVTDAHLGNNNFNGEAARRHFRQALAEIAAWSPQPRCILVTADLVCSGRRSELLEYVEIAEQSSVPLHALPANHDLWGEPDGTAWLDLVGPMRQTVDMDDLRIVLFQDIHRKPDGSGWQARLNAEELAWVDARLAEWTEGRAIAAFHAPILEEGESFHDSWRDSNAAELLAIFRRHGTVAALTGHWHRVNEWTVRGVRVINSGALVGWQWTGIPPYYSFPVRAGYMLYHYDSGKLRRCWREVGQQEQDSTVQVLVDTIGGVHVGGPRPQVRPPHVFMCVPFRVQTCAPAQRIEAVQWSLSHGQWQAMEPTFDGIWQDWEAVLDPAQFRAGEHILAVRALVEGRPRAYDAIPVHLSEAKSPPAVPVLSGREQVFELFYTPE